MSKEIEKVNEAEAKMAALYGGQESSPVRRVKLHKVDREISYYQDEEDHKLKDPELKLTIIGITRKYELRKFDDSTNALDYSYATTEFPYSDWDYPIKVLNYTDKKNVKTLSDFIPAKDFKEWCEKHDDEARADVKAKKRKGFIEFSKMWENGVGTTFKALTILYGVDKEDNLYRVELTSTSKESLWAALKKYTNKIPFYHPTTIKFEDEITTIGTTEFYVPILEVGKVYDTTDKLKYMKKAQEFIVALAARQKSGGQKQTETNDDLPFEDEPKQLETESLDDII